MKNLLRYFTLITIILFFVSQDKLAAQLIINKTANTNFIQPFPFAPPEIVTFTITVQNPDLCAIEYTVTDNLQKTLGGFYVYTPTVGSISVDNGTYTILPNDHEFSWENTVAPGETDTLIVQTEFGYPFDFPPSGSFNYKNTAIITYYNHCCDDILTNADPDDDILCLSCEEILNDATPSNDTICFTSCYYILNDANPSNDSICLNSCYYILNDTIIANDTLCPNIVGCIYLNDNIPENDILCYGFQEPTVDSADVDLDIYFCDFSCDAFFSYEIDQCTGTVNADFWGWAFFDGWMLDGQFISSDFNYSQSLTPGTYELCASAANECFSNGCIYCETIFISDSQLLAVDIPQTNFCMGDPVTLFANVPPLNLTLSYEWEGPTLTGANGQTVTAFPLAIETYTVTVTDEYNCTATTETTFIPSPRPIINNIITNCNGNGTPADTSDDFHTIVIDVSVMNGFSFTNQYSLESNISGVLGTSQYDSPLTITLPADGAVHTFTVSDIGDPSCPESAQTQALDPCSVCTNPTVSITTNDNILTCNNPSTTLFATPINNATYQWSNGASNNEILTVFSSGTYTVTVCDNGCCDQADIIITEDFNTPPLSITSNTTTLDCNNPTIDLTANAPTTFFQWDNGMNVPTISVTTAGEYTVTATDLFNGCTSTESITISQNDISPIVFINAPTTELNNTVTSIQLDAIATGTGNLAYEWTGGNTNPSLTVTSLGVYMVTVTDIDNGCSTVETITITQAVSCTLSTSIIANPEIATCDNPTIVLTVSSNPPESIFFPYDYQWSPNTLGQTGQNIPVIPTQPEIYSVTVTDPNGCTASADIFIDVDFFVPTVFINAPTTELNNSVTSIQLDAIATGNGNLAYEWTGGNTNPSLTVTSPGVYTVTVTDIDNGCFITESINIIQATCEYFIPSNNLACNDIGNNTICVPLESINAVPNGIIGMDYCMTYDPNVLTPTGNVVLGNVVLDGNTNAGYAVNTTGFPNMVCLSIFYNSNAPVGTNFLGQGEIACVEFSLNNPSIPGTSDFGILNLIESYESSISEECAENGTIDWQGNSDPMNGKITYWNDANLPLLYDVDNPLDNLPTYIYRSDVDCNIIGNPALTDLDGNFEIDTENATHININRDINNSIIVMGTINGFDSYLVHLVTTLDPSYVPNPYEIIAMDVNMDGNVTAGDITHMENRIILNIGEYPQAWNANNGQASKDWLFIDETAVSQDAGFQISSTYPFGDGLGYDRLNVPRVPICQEIAYDNNASCPSPLDMDYHAILLGDVDKSWDLTVYNMKESSGDILLDLDKAIVLKDVCSMLIPIRVENLENLKSLDFILDYNSDKLIFESFVYGDITNNDMRMAYNLAEDGNILFSSYTKMTNGLANSANTLYYARFSMQDPDELITPNDFSFIDTYLDGLTSGNTISNREFNCSDEEIYVGEPSVRVYPNPFAGNFNIELSGYPADTEFKLNFYDVAGKLIESKTFTETLYKYERLNLPTGFYLYELKIGKEVIDSGRLMSAE